MGVRVVLYYDRHPDTDPAHGVLVGKLKGVVEQMEQEEAAAAERVDGPTHQRARQAAAPA